MTIDQARLTLTVLSLLGLAAAPVSAQTVQKKLPIIVNGRAHASQAVTIGAQTYVPLSVLKELGVAYAVSGTTLSVGTTGGATQTRALEGCLGQELFNGNWRVRVEDVTFGKAKYGGRPTWFVKVRYGNASSAPNKLYINSLQSTGEPMVLILKDGTQLSLLGVQEGNGEQFAPASQRTLTYGFGQSGLLENNPPVKMLLLFKEKPSVGTYTVSDPNMRFDLTCQK